MCCAAQLNHYCVYQFCGMQSISSSEGVGPSISSSQISRLVSSLIEENVKSKEYWFWGSSIFDSSSKKKWSCSNEDI